MATEKTKTVKFKENDINKLPNNKPVVYKILTKNNNNTYTGVAKKGRVRERVKEHLGKIPGSKVRIEQMSSISEAASKEANIIARVKPKYNLLRDKPSLKKSQDKPKAQPAVITSLERSLNKHANIWKELSKY